jgi:DNA modification methylase
VSVRLLTGDCLTHLRSLPDDSIDCVVTSPPYWGLRDYGIAPSIWGGDPDCAHEFGGDIYVKAGGGQPGEKNRWQHDGGGPSGHPAVNAGCYCRKCDAFRGVLGLEPTLAQHLENLVIVFREVRRVLKKTGTCWVNYGDAYACAPNGRSAADTKAIGEDDRTFRDKPISTVGGTLKPKDRMLLPARFAIAMCDDGWWLRDEIVWHKPNPMPSSVKDRTTPAHEMIYMFSKAPRYYYDQVAIRNPPSEALLKQVVEGYNGSDTKDYDGAKAQSASGTKARIIEGARKKIKVPGGWDKGDGAHGTIHRDGRTEALYTEAKAVLGSNKRSVWTVAPKPFREAHFATFPPDLIEPCILAGTPGQVCSSCGAPWVREISVTYENPGNRTTNGPRSLEQRHETAGFAQRLEKRTETLGFKPTCKCDAGAVPGTCLDPFGGAGTTALVAQRNGRSSILIELNPSYVAIAERRLFTDDMADLW